MPPSNPAPIVVAGDVSIDWLAWPVPAVREAGSDTPNWRQQEGTRMVARRGGALLLVDLLVQATKHPVVGPRVSGIELKTPDEHLHSLVDLTPKPTGKDKIQTFGISQRRGFCGPDGRHPPQPPLDGSIEGATLLLLDDSGNGFRETPSAWRSLLADARPRWVIVKMARPLAAGAMWEAVRRGPIGPNGQPDPERLIVVLNADDLRAEGIALSRRLSWERTSEDFVRELGSNGRLDTLVTCAHLVVRFDCDGVIHHRGRSAEPPVLYFDPAHAEGEFVDAQGGRMIGMTAAFTAGLAGALAEDPDHGLEAGIRHGMTASRRLATAGFQEDEKHAPDYPRAYAATGMPELGIMALSIPSKQIAAGESWSILRDTLGDPGNTSRRVLSEGPTAALTRVPVARFGKLQTADRREIESFRAIANLLREYLSAPRTKPISIGVFGPPGAGKSFGVTEVAAHVARDRKLTLLEFNLSQFTSLDDLLAAFHLVRDSGLSGDMPLVFFDEFDSAFGGELGWLRYFLAPMQDGKFRQNGHSHPLGAAILVFAGGTRSSFANFVAPMSEGEDNRERLAFANAKGPDFVSRLRGHVDILGPDPMDLDDRTYPIRRAFLLRSLIERDARSLISGTRIRIDDGVLNAFLAVRAYRHGVRSMEAILAMSRLTGHTQFDRSALPPSDQLELHVDAPAFMTLVGGERLDDDLREQLGRFLHKVYRKQRLTIAGSKAERTQLAADNAMRDWEDLDEVFRESSRLQADDIPSKLRLINCFMTMETEGRIAVENFEPEEVTTLAEAEHERYNAERLRRQWQLGERDPSVRRNPFLVPWRDLPKKWRSLDESAVMAIPSALAAVGWRVYRAK